jgi:hypothetical protein
MQKKKRKKKNNLSKYSLFFFLDRHTCTHCFYLLLFLLENKCKKSIQCRKKTIVFTFFLKTTNQHFLFLYKFCLFLLMYGINLFTPAIFDYYYWWSTTLGQANGPIGWYLRKRPKGQKVKKSSSYTYLSGATPSPPMQHSWPSFNYSIYLLYVKWVPQ